jgi:hypothetical protein
LDQVHFVLVDCSFNGACELKELEIYSLSFWSVVFIASFYGSVVMTAALLPWVDAHILHMDHRDTPSTFQFVLQDILHTSMNL